jgi:hypothetical protein
MHSIAFTVNAFVESVYADVPNESLLGLASVHEECSVP